MAASVEENLMNFLNTQLKNRVDPVTGKSYTETYRKTLTSGDDNVDNTKVQIPEETMTFEDLLKIGNGNKIQIPELETIRIEPKIGKPARKEIRNNVHESLLKRDEEVDQVRQKLRDELRQSVRDELREELKPEIRKELDGELRKNMKTTLESVRDQLRGELWDELNRTVRDELLEELKPEIRNELRSIDGELRNELNLNLRVENENLKIFLKQTESVHDKLLGENENLKSTLALFREENEYLKTTWVESREIIDSGLKALIAQAELVTEKKRLQVENENLKALNDKHLNEMKSNQDSSSSILPEVEVSDSEDTLDDLSDEDMGSIYDLFHDDGDKDLDENEDSSIPWMIVITLILAFFFIFRIPDWCFELVSSSTITTLVLSIISGAVLGTGVALASFVIGHQEMKSNHPLLRWNLHQLRIDEDEDENEDENENEDEDECDYSLEILSTLQHEIPNMISTFVYSICIIMIGGGALIFFLHF